MHKFRSRPHSFSSRVHRTSCTLLVDILVHLQNKQLDLNVLYLKCWLYHQMPRSVLLFMLPSALCPSVFYVGTLIAYRHIVFKLEKVYVKNCEHKQNNMCRPPTHPPTPGVWNKSITGIKHKKHVLYPHPPTHPWGGLVGHQKIGNWNCACLQYSSML